MRGVSNTQCGLCLLALTAALSACGKSGPDGLAGESIAGDKGPAGDPGAEGQPSITSMTPKQIFIDRVVDVTISA